ncbi:hypothetical protein CEXT_151761 [Caerostris extrusa]|uniref:Uncharacterized protein n=1 Tax=Caerostris extrusa TaxID=172846 RepID=A0AAV4UVF3_CAEEX|nr:hypothetical protein CEXT_151761 [Caerostris extrusa]
MPPIPQKLKFSIRIVIHNGLGLNFQLTFLPKCLRVSSQELNRTSAHLLVCRWAGHSISERLFNLLTVRLLLIFSSRSKTKKRDGSHVRCLSPSILCPGYERPGRIRELCESGGLAGLGSDEGKERERDAGGSARSRGRQVPRQEVLPLGGMLQGVSLRRHRRVVSSKSVSDPQFPCSVLFIDEKSFTRERIFKTHNMHMWAVDNPHGTRAPSHYGISVRVHLTGHLEVDGPVAWPPRTPDLQPLDFYLWRTVKAIVYETPVNFVIDLVATISIAAATIREKFYNFENVRNFNHV